MINDDSLSRNVEFFTQTGSKNVTKLRPPPLKHGQNYSGVSFRKSISNRNEEQESQHRPNEESKLI